MSNYSKTIWICIIFCNLLLILLKVKPELFVKHCSEPTISNVNVSTHMVESRQVVQGKAMTYIHSTMRRLDCDIYDAIDYALNSNAKCIN